jgi:hypothetical protein
MGKDVVRSLHTRNVELIAPRLYRAKDDVEALVRVILIQPCLEIRRLSVIVEIHYTPFNVEYAIRRAA